jgi:hypothetical protein
MLEYHNLSRSVYLAVMMAALIIDETAKVIVSYFLTTRLIVAPPKHVKTSCKGSITVENGWKW